MHATSPQGRFTEGAAAVDGATLGAAEAHGKHLFLHLSTGGSVHVHLGMQGKWFRSTDPAAPPLRQVRLRLATDGVAWDLVAPCECEVLDPAAVTEVVSRLGPDPLRPDDSAERAVRALHRAGGAIGAALLDQAVVSGVGNVFRSEALHAVGVAPMRPARAMREPELGSVWGGAAADDVPSGGGRPHRHRRRAGPAQPARERVAEGPQQDRCRDCWAPVVTGRVGGRTSYHCPMEQRS